MPLRSFDRRFAENILKEGEKVKFRNERKRFAEFIEALTRFPSAVSAEQTLNEPYKSLAFIVTVGQRPMTALLILDLLLKAEETPLNGKEIGQKLAEKLEISPALTTKGGNYKDRVGDLLSAFTKIGILERVSPDKPGHPKKEGFRIRKSAMAEVEAFIASFKLEEGVLDALKPLNLREHFKNRFDRRLKYVIKAGSNKKQQFSIGKIMKSLLDPKLGVSFEKAIQIVEKIEPQLKTGMRTVDIQSRLYNALMAYDEKAAENYRRSYPEISSLTMSDGETEIVNYQLVKTLIDKEVKLKLTSSLFDQLASTVYNVITRNPKNYRSETAVREYVDALIRSECIRFRTEASFVRDHLESSVSALEGCRNSLSSDEVLPARGLLGQFLEQIVLVALVEFGYLPFKDFEKNVDLISNLLKQNEVKEEIKSRLQLDESDVFKFQRVKSLMHRKDTASRKSLERIIEEGERLVQLCKDVSSVSGQRIEPKAAAAEISEGISPSHVSTGYEELDNLLQGGILERYAVILTSPSCDERDLLIERFLEAGLTEGQMTFHITIDASGVEALVESFPSNFHLFLCNPEADAMIKNLPNVTKVKGVENLNNIDIALTSTLRKMDKTPKKTRRACIEIVSDVLLQHQAVTTRKWLAALLPRFKARGFTILAVMNSHMHLPQDAQAILDLFQGEIHIFKEKTEKGLKRFLRIERMYNQQYLELELPLKKEKIHARSPLQDCG